MTMNRTPIIAGNWKMHTTSDEAVTLVDDMLDDLTAIEGVEVVLCPPFISLVPVREMLVDTPIQLGAQDVFWEPKGAFTGEISPTMLEPLCRYVIVGHSERRQYFDETDDIVERKARAALAHNLQPIICVGDTLQQYDSGRTHDVVSQQILNVFSRFNPEQAARCVVAYEPIWAIGTGRAAHGEEAQATIAVIRTLLAELFGGEVAGQMRIQYGGSVTSANIAEFIEQPDIDGALVGGASLKAADFVRICAITQQHKSRS
jgi:triosephosphate isomerase